MSIYKLRVLLTTLVIIVIAVSCNRRFENQTNFTENKKELRVVSLSPSITELIALHSSNQLRIVGRTDSCNFPPNIKEIPSIAYIKPNYEKILKLNPGLVLYDKLLYTPADISKLTSLKINSFGINSSNYQEFKKSILELEKLTNRYFHGTNYIQSIEKALEDNKIKKTTCPKISIISNTAEATNEYIAGKESFQAKIINILGGELIGPNSDKFELLSKEWLLSQQVDTIIVSSNEQVNLLDKKLNSLKAVKNNRIYPIFPDLLLRMGGRIPELIKEIADILKR